MRILSRFITGGAALRNRDFRWLAIGSGLNSGGMQGEQVIVGLLVYRMTESSAWVGVSLALFFAPMLLVGIPAGALADRFDRRALLCVAEAGLVLCLASFALFLGMGAVGLLGALAISLLSGCLRALHHPARLSYAGDVSGKAGLVAALSVLSITTRGGQLAGALAAGFLSEAYSPAIAYGALSIGHVVAWWCFAQTSKQQVKTTQPTRQGVGKGIGEYLIALRKSSVLRLLILFACVIEVFGFSFVTAMPEIAVVRLSLADEGLGAMHAARAVGGLLGAIGLSLLVARHLGYLYLGVMLSFGLALVCFAFAPSMHLALIAIAFIALCASLSDILVQSMLQIAVPEAQRGRAMGAWVFALGMGPIGHLELGLLLSMFGAAAALTVNAAALIIIGVGACFLAPAVRDLKNATV